MELQIFVMITYDSLTCFRVLAVEFSTTRFDSTILLTEPNALLRLLNVCPILDTSLDSNGYAILRNEIGGDFSRCHEVINFSQIISKNIALKLTACRPKLNIARGFVLNATPFIFVKHPRLNLVTSSE